MPHKNLFQNKNRHCHFFLSWHLLHLVQANGRLTFEDDLRSGGLLYFTTLHRGVSFFSGGFISAIVVNPLERRLAIRTSVHNTQADAKVVISHHDCSPWHENSSMSER